MNTLRNGIKFANRNFQDLNQIEGNLYRILLHNQSYWHEYNYKYDRADYTYIVRTRTFFGSHVDFDNFTVIITLIAMSEFALWRLLVFHGD